MKGGGADSAFMNNVDEDVGPFATLSAARAFGCVVWAMLTGRAAFAGETVSDTIADVLDLEPAWDALPPDIPVNVQRLLRRCLESDPRRRPGDVSDAQVEPDDQFSPEVRLRARRSEQLHAVGRRQALSDQHVFHGPRNAGGRRARLGRRGTGPLI
jgi:serine/threonine protein kinase